MSTPSTGASLSRWNTGSADMMENIAGSSIHGVPEIQQRRVVCRLHWLGMDVTERKLVEATMSTIESTVD